MALLSYSLGIPVCQPPNRGLCIFGVQSLFHHILSGYGADGSFTPFRSAGPT
ncbi:hypothetical protein ATPR_3410 [Acetobacter tropicalis NBRC 101654]|uniref:Uncharacterized protein n=1 Tax=Acetobacter tropicalis NBRC 101654 TaxID=749388 RepID=F7VJ61_9PROT|nr:hypothetical protein ATPR_3410 [Acetobacter tropicalis NBRC 101654]